jgi:hypothetical protein
VHAEANGDARKRPKRPREGSQPANALRELEELAISGAGESACGHVRAPDGAVLISKKVWREACRERRLSEEGNPASERKAFDRAVRELRAIGLLGEYGDVVWLITKRP